MSVSMETLTVRLEKFLLASHRRQPGSTPRLPALRSGRPSGQADAAPKVARGGQGFPVSSAMPANPTYNIGVRLKYGRSGQALALVGANTQNRQAWRATAINRSRAKRSLDVAAAGSLILILLPALLLIAFLIRLESRGPALFRQERYGVGRRVFVMYKFRSMTVMETSGGFVQARAGDRRVTRVGRLLRRTSLDELPQLMNVLKGDMSLVGPRPHAVAMDDAYAGVISRYDERHLVRPGVTGLAQVCGYRGPTDTLAKIESRVWRDRVYIRRWSFFLDIKLLARTPLALLDPNAL